MPYKSHIHRAQVKVAVAQGRMGPAIMRQLDEESRGMRLPTCHFPRKKKPPHNYTQYRRCRAKIG